MIFLLFFVLFFKVMGVFFALKGLEIIFAILFLAIFLTNVILKVIKGKYNISQVRHADKYYDEDKIEIKE